MFYAETLLFINDHKPQVLELDLRVEQLMRADDQVNAAVFKAFGCFSAFFRRLEPAEHFYCYREAFITFCKCFIVLLRQEGSRHKHCNLF